MFAPTPQPHWLLGLDSNQGKEIQNLLCCRYTTEQLGIRKAAPRLLPAPPEDTESQHIRAPNHGGAALRIP